MLGTVVAEIFHCDKLLLHPRTLLTYLNMTEEDGKFQAM